MLNKKTAIIIIAIIAISFVYGCVTSSENGGTDENGGTNGGTNGGDENPWEDFAFYSFSGGEHFRYDIVSDEDTGYLTIDIGQPNANNEFLMEFEVILSDETYDGDITTTSQTWQTDLIDCDMMADEDCIDRFVISTFLTLSLGTYFSYFEFYAFSSYTWTDAGHTMTIDPNVRTQSYAGVSSTCGQITFNGDLVYEACYSLDLAFASHTAYYDEEGEVWYSMTLTEYTN